MATVKVRGIESSRINVAIDTDQVGRFEVSVRHPTEALPQLCISAVNHDGSKMGFHRIAWEEKDRVVENIKLKLEETRTVEVKVIDADGSAIEHASVAIQLEWPHVLAGFTTDAKGLARIELPRSERIGAVFAWKGREGLDYRVFAVDQRAIKDTNAVSPEFPEGVPLQLTLAGATALRVKVVDDAGIPLSGVKLYPWVLTKEQVSNQLNLSFFADSIQS